jgi:exodeoxyribonuclease VII small subunit
MAKKESRPVEELTYEDAFNELGTIVEALEAAEHPLEESVTLFERGQALAKHCAELLDKAELKVQKLVGDSISDLAENQ